jgi:hypothetical protein
MRAVSRIVSLACLILALRYASFCTVTKFGAFLHALSERITTSICVVLLLVALCSTLSGMSTECSASPVSRATSFLQLPRLEDHSTTFVSFASFYSKTFDSNTPIRFTLFQDSRFPSLPTSLHLTNQNQNQIQSIYNNTSLWDTPLDQ